MPEPPYLHLASQSPRRARLLEQIGVSYGVVEAGADEAHRAGETADAYVERLARAKAEAGGRKAGLPDRADGLALGADTAIDLHGRILGKPCDDQEVRSWLLALSGRTHHVVSGVAVTDGRTVESRVNRTDVTMREIDPEEIEAYLATGEPRDKAGGYAIQGRGAVFVERLDGSYSAVMGLPLFETDQLLRAFGRGAL